jgi:adenylate kinase
MHKYVIMGKQGSGKGTQAKMLKQGLNLVHISVGDIFRWNIQARTKLGAKVKRIVSSGELVPDEVVEQIVHRRLQEHDWNYGFILDGFPRNAAQAEFFLESYDVNAVIHIDIPDQVVVDRVLARRVCSQCGLDYNLIFHRPENEEVCDVCGGALRSRPDDNEEALRQRLRDFNEKTMPTLELFQRKELIVTVDGTRKPKQIQSDIRGRLDLPELTADDPEPESVPAGPGGG